MRLPRVSCTVTQRGIPAAARFRHPVFSPQVIAPWLKSDSLSKSLNLLAWLVDVSHYLLIDNQYDPHCSEIPLKALGLKSKAFCNTAGCRSFA